MDTLKKGTMVRIIGSSDVYEVQYSSTYYNSGERFYGGTNTRTGINATFSPRQITKVLEGKLVQFAAPEGKPKVNVEKKEFNFVEQMEKNKQNEDRVKKERHESNNSTIRSELLPRNF